ncbi:cell surface protein SprA [Rubrivirga litoralis]|uniref:Cell surface protein SprA n=1 Tax=Rubrivirga litoralis TaxID=3075598 RepID=A0ABU3BLW9_9BACT|nr:cell surface protein SprA [Rubrivirga sp. F394]MDT0630287.1 cell surface protein SprA [Rubrivirga sp. F394]
MRALTPRTPPTPRRRLALLGAASVGVLLVLAAHAGTVEAGPGAPRGAGWLAPADSDTVRTTPPAPAPPAAVPLRAAPPAAGDSALVGGAADSTERAEAYFRGPRAPGLGAALAARRRPGVRGRLGTYWRREVTLDSAAYRYRVRETVGDADVRAPADVGLGEFLMARRQEAVGETFRSLAAQRSQRQTRRNGLGFAVEIPGGEESAFRTLFGKNEVSLTVNGTSDLNLGVRYDQSDIQAARRLKPPGVDPDFGQDLTLNIAGMVGDKLTVNVNYDTNSQFEFENQVSLVYEGYEDDILQRFEAGNVFLQTPATLIQGGQRLFGLRTDFQFGPLAVTAVASQKDAQTVQQTITGGADVRTFALAPYDYEDDTHFFLGYAFHNWWDAGHQDPSQPTLPPGAPGQAGFRELVGVQVWKHEPSLRTLIREDQETTWAVALADLGEPAAVLAGGEAYLGAFDAATGQYENAAAPLPDPALDQYTEAILAPVREDGSSTGADNILGSGASIPQSALFNNVFRLLRDGVDYTVDGQLGWLSLTTALTEDEVLAVAYQYRTADGRLVSVGDYLQPAQSSAQTGPRTILKLLRAPTPVPEDPLWDLTLRNVYRVGGRSLSASTFDLALTFEPPGGTPNEIPSGLSLGGRTLLAAFGLDRLGEQGQSRADNTFDFRVGYTIDPGAGRVIFPTRQPFGDYAEALIRTGQTVTRGDRLTVAFEGLDEAAALDLYAPVLGARPDARDLYDVKRANAQRQIQGLARYRIAGEYRSATQSVFPLGFQIVEGTVRVTSDGRELAEGTDYRVNTTSGTVEIVNPLYLQSGQQIEVTAEQQDLFAVTSKTLLGLRADYRISENALLGATWMQLSERPPVGVGKFQVGAEALDNTVVGVDGSYLAAPRWLTRAVDALPLIQTRAPSAVELRGEYARLTPGHPQTRTFGEARGALRDAGLDFADDELAGVSYIDDFEGSETAYTAPQQTTGWSLAAAPESAGPPGTTLRPAGGAGVTSPDLKNNWRGLFTWYSLAEGDYEGYEERGLLTPAASPISRVDLYEIPGTPTREDVLPLGLLDVYFDPTRRGPHNYSDELDATLGPRRRDVWGGFVRPIEGAFSDFGGRNNVEFVEMLFAPLGGRDGREPVAPGARMYLDLGQVNEDVLPNGVFNSEDGLGNNPSVDAAPFDAFSRRPSQQANGVVDFFDGTGQTEDVGIDGLPTRPALTASGGTPYAFSEESQFAPFLARLPAGGAVRARALADPSGDDFHNFDDDEYFDGPLFPGGASVQERYGAYYPATELNSPIARSRIIDGGRGLTARPDNEDIDENGRTNTADQYHRYEIPLDDAGLRASPFFREAIDVDNRVAGRQTWYLLRIPVRTPDRTVVGLADTSDFSRIEAVRLWTTGHDKPATIRFASFELAGSQWLKSGQVGRVGAGDSTSTLGPEPSLFVASINNEENPSTYAVPRGTVLNTTPSVSGGAAQTQREKALVFRAEGLGEGRRAAIVRSYATRPLDLTKYRNLRMAVHGDGFDRRDSVRVFLRIGDDEAENYYEIEQPAYPFDPARLAALAPCPPAAPSNCARSDSLWQTQVPVGGARVDLNPVNLVLRELNALKRARDLSATPPGARFTRAATEDGVAPGARLTVRGEPSLQDVRTVVLGVRNAPGGAAAPLDVEVWYNELRVSGYDEEGGGSGFLLANVALADVATVNARLSFIDDGFGDLGGALGGRSFAAQRAFTLTSTFAAHKLLPERFGWAIPVSVSATENTSTPRFDPDNGDVRLDDLADAVAEQGGGAGRRELTADEVVRRAQTATSSRNVRVQATKTGSRSPWLRYTVDGLTASYTLSTQDGRNPSSARSAQDTWTGNLAYRLTVPEPFPVRPFGFARGVPVLGSVLGGLQLNLLPQSLSLSADVARRTSATEPRLREQFLGEPDEVQSFRAFTRRTQLFDHGRQIDVRYNPFSFLQLSYASNTDQDLGRAGQRETLRYLVRDPSGPFQRVYEFDPLDLAGGDVRDDPGVLADLAAAGLLEDGAFPAGVEVLGGAAIDVLPVGEALGNLFGSGPGLRTRRYDQTLTTTLRVSTRRVKWLSWLQPQALSYSANYSWADQPIASAPDLEVASAGTRGQVQSSLRIVPRDFWRLFPFYRRLEAAAGRGGAAPGAEARSAEGGAAADSAGRGALPVRLARGAFLGLTGIDDVTLTYRGSLTSATGGLEGQGYSLFSALSGAAPPIGYRLGLDRELGLDRRVFDDRVNRFGDQSGTQHDLDARTQLSPFRGLNVGLTWRVGWSSTRDRSFSPNLLGGLSEGLPQFRGAGEATVLSFGASYRGFVRRQADRYLADREAAGGAERGQTIGSEVLSPTGLAEDFGAEFGRGAGRFGPGGFYPVPLPSWTVTYSGLERLPVLRSLAESVSLQHGYSSTSQVGVGTFYADPERPRLPELDGVRLAGAATFAEDGFDEPVSLSVNQRFQPLLGVTVGWKGGVQTSVKWNQSTVYQLATAAADVNEKSARDVRLEVGYAKTGLNLLGLGRLNNNVRVTLTASFADDHFMQYPLREDLGRVVAEALGGDAEPEGDGDPFRDPEPRFTKRLLLSPRVSYTVSDRVTADVFATYERLDQTLGGGGNTRFNGGVNLRVLFSN